MSTKSTVYYNEHYPFEKEGSIHIYWQHLTDEFRIEIEAYDDSKQCNLVDVPVPKELVEALQLKYVGGYITSNIKKEEQ